MNLIMSDLLSHSELFRHTDIVTHILDHISLGFDRWQLLLNYTF